MDVDLQHDPTEIGRFIEVFEQSRALVIAIRRRSGDMPLQRRISNFLVAWICSLLAGRKISDVQCGFRLIPISLLKLAKLTGKRYELESELVIRAGRARFPIEEITIDTIYNQSKSSIRPISDTLRFLKMAFQSLFW
jgi:hypothetical protein